MKNRPSSRRGIVIGLAALPLAGGATIAAEILLDYEARFLALRPELLPLLVEHDRLWAVSHGLYEIAYATRPPLAAWQYDQPARAKADAARDALPEWRAYVAARRPADAICEHVEAIVAPFMELRMQTLPAILFKHRIGKTLRHYEDDASIDLDALIEGGTLCA